MRTDFESGSRKSWCEHLKSEVREKAGVCFDVHHHDSILLNGSSILSNQFWRDAPLSSAFGHVIWMKRTFVPSRSGNDEDVVTSFEISREA